MNRAKNNETDNAEIPAQAGKFRFAGIFAKTNRGMLLDVGIFFINLILMSYLTRLFIETAQAASGGDFLASFALFLFMVAIFILPPAGAILKRWHFHHRLQLEGKASKRPEVFLGGCLFNPIFYFCLNCLIFVTLNAFVLSFFYGSREPDGGVFVSSILFGIVLIILQTFIVYRYFSPPKTQPKSEFLLDPRSEALGDACIFLNMILYQVLWNLITEIPMARPSTVSVAAEIGFRFFFLLFASLFIYFPPRIFYLAEDIHRRRVWLTILLANSPVLLKFIYGGF